ncbi:MAG TPA: VCBS repeat-containing protein [Longimicrobiales bacterium]|nr:VCBS repeat-containing protein [Longimicrobiales bacterium]
MKQLWQHGLGFFLLFALALVTGCSGADGTSDGRAAGQMEPSSPDGPLFTMLPSSYTGVDFANRLVDTRELNVFTYRNYYNGGGVALGDLTGDGLPELVLTSNLDGPRLYLNEGNFRFRDVTEKAGLEGRGAWATGVTLADVNGDGLLDIYVCYAGRAAGEDRANELYIHQGLNADGVPTFRESAGAYGIADEGYSTHAVFFDYDRDGDLDLYVVNNSPRPVSSFGLQNTRRLRHQAGGDRLYRNDDGQFVDVSEQAGIFGSEIGFGLGVAVGDLNGDGWPDIYVSNDFFERDYLYINQQDGTFAEVLSEQMPSISLSSMGLDLGDIDNDGRLDLYVTDMLPEDEYRLRTMTAFESWEEYQRKLKNGYHHQFTRNTLQLNNGNGTFSEIGQLAGVARTDWSWSALLADLDQDGYVDIHVTNGIPRDLTSRDYLAHLASDATLASALQERNVDFLRLVGEMASTPLPNYAFRNNGDLTFSRPGPSWGLESVGFSNGAAYGDLDGDGALDLVVNNLNRESSIYRNNARAVNDHRYLQIALEGSGANRFAVGAKVTLRAGSRLFVQELMPSRGFQSSVDYVLTFGIGTLDTLDSVTVEWPDGRRSVLRSVAADQRVTVRQADAEVAVVETDVAETESVAAGARPVFTRTAVPGLDIPHRENAFADFSREPLIPKLLSTEGPYMAVADVNGDGLEDVFLGGAKDQPGQLLLQGPDGAFTPSSADVFARDRVAEDLGAVFFDADGDGAPDLYVVSGGSEFSDMAPALHDRLYLNDGRGGFRKAEGALPARSISGSRVTATDFDGDGHLDLFVGGRVIPWRYGLDPASALLRNDGTGRFTDVTRRIAPELERVGMVTDALWQDVDGDGRPDLVVVGEWMPVTIFRNTGERLVRLNVPGLERSHGWWNRIIAADLDGDGHTDFVLGNLGLNTRLRATPERPVTMHVGDFDRNGFIEQIVSSYGEHGVSVPLASREDLLQALPSLTSRYPDFDSYARASTADLFTRDELAGAVEKRAYTFESAVAWNDGAGSFTLEPLPTVAQFAPVHALLVEDFDGDGTLDILLAGNFDGVKPDIGRMAAGYGVLLRGDGRRGFTPVHVSESGFSVPGQARDIRRLRTARGVVYVVARNNQQPLIFRSTGRAPLAARRERRGSAARPLGPDHDDAVRAPDTVHGRVGGILQDLDRRDLVRVDRRQAPARSRVERDAIDDV